MDSVERIGRTIHFQPCDRPPVVAQVFAHAAVVCGRTVGEYVSSGSRAAACQLEARDRYGYDAVFAALDCTLEAEAVGGEVLFRRDLYPAVVRPPCSPEDDFSRLAIPDPASAGRLPMALEMAGILRRACGDETLVVGFVQGPMTLAAQFLGLEKALYLAADDPDRFLRLLDYAAAVGRSFGLAQLAAGAHLVLVFEPAACPEVVPAGLFREMIGPRLAPLFAAFTQAGAIGNWLHIAGQTASILPRYPALGATIGNFDYCVDAEAVLASLVDSRLCLDGNVKSLSFVTDTPDQIAQDAGKLLRLFDRRGGFILSSGCEIPPESQEANVAALVQAARAWKLGRS